MMYSDQTRHRRVPKCNYGFTLIEVLLVIAILAILAGITILAINPSRQLANAHDSQRTSDVYSILSAIHQYAADNEGAFPDEITTSQREICRTDAGVCTGLSDLSVLTEGQEYMVSIPNDPLCPNIEYCTENGTGYYIQLTAGGRVSVRAPNTELTDEINIIR